MLWSMLAKIVLRYGHHNFTTQKGGQSNGFRFMGTQSKNLLRFFTGSNVVMATCNSLCEKNDHNLNDIWVFV